MSLLLRVMKKGLEPLLPSQLPEHETVNRTKAIRSPSGATSGPPSSASSGGELTCALVTPLWLMRSMCLGEDSVPTKNDSSRVGDGAAAPWSEPAGPDPAN